MAALERFQLFRNPNSKMSAEENTDVKNVVNVDGDHHGQDVPQLSAETFEALSQFYQEQDDLEKELASIQLMAAQGSGVAQVSEAASTCRWQHWSRM